MGFSTSGSLLLVFFALFVAVGTLYSVSANTTEELTEATDDQQERIDDVQQSRVNVTAATWDPSVGNLTIRVNNTGETRLDAADVDVIVDGEYRDTTDFERVEVAGTDSTVWLPGEQLVLEDADVATKPTRVKVVTGPGVADIAFVTEVSG
ncbi:hypothetical protein BRD09_01445 [Halobacteriales archaeon SW_10_68_16]|nr:MAG: hypothetical protein BRD09_01445 [Halobacteriales archaeon SW_10_68_16]